MVLFSPRNLALALSLTAVCSATASTPTNFRVKERVAHPRGWKQLEEAHPDHEIFLRIGLPQGNFDTLEKHLYEVSDPYHTRYGAHLSKEEVESLIAPHSESIDAVNTWLRDHGFDEDDLVRSPAKDWVTIKVPVRLAEKMLDTRYHVWQHTKTGSYIIRTTSYSLPSEMHRHIDVIQPTTMFARWTAMKSTLHWPDMEEITNIFDSKKSPAVDPSCNTSITVSCLQQLYNTVGYVPQATKKNAIGITGYLEEFASEADLQSFYADQLPAAVNSTFTFVSVKGGLNNQTVSDAGIEANLDVQFAFGLSFPTPGTFWSTAGRPPFIPDLGTPTNTNEPYADWLDFVLSHNNLPQSISTSYGDHEQTVPEAYAKRVCQDFAQLGARGVSLLFSSGDGGVGDGDPDPTTQECLTNDGRNITRFIPSFPASCPFVTSVGGTNNVPEVAVFFSGGGFSDYFPRPVYQQYVVDEYLKKIPQGLYRGLFNRNGRAIPDVAAQGRRFRVWWQGKKISVGGTSASSPTFAAIVALLNDARLAKNLPPLGFLNPLIYTKGITGFNDITVGNNPGCGTPGFNATIGWDPVTGLGTPDFRKLKNLIT